MKTYKRALIELIESKAAFKNIWRTKINPYTLDDTIGEVVDSLTNKNAVLQIELDEARRINKILSDKSVSAVEIKSLSHVNFMLKLRVMELESSVIVESNDECTCDKEEAEEHICPLKSDVDKEYLCVCCEFCSQNCLDDI